MKKLLILFSILGMILTSCGYSIIDNYDKTPVITHILKYNRVGSEGCKYYGDGGKMFTWSITDDNFMFADTCGKYNIGDTLIISKR